MSREAAGMIPGESLRSFLGEGGSETERESPQWLPSSCSSASLIIKGVCFNSVVSATFKDPYSGAPAATKHSGKPAHKGTSGLFFFQLKSTFCPSELKEHRLNGFLPFCISLQEGKGI